MSGPFEALRVDAPGTIRCRCPNTVAIGANDDAILKLSFKSADRRTGEDQIGDVPAFVVEVVELENVGIGLATVRTPLGS